MGIRDGHCRDRPDVNEVGGGTMRYRSFQNMTLMLLFIFPLLFSCKANDAGKYRLAIYGPVHVYPSSTPPADYPGSGFIAVVGPKDHVDVKQVIRKRDHVAVRIRLHDGREGWVFTGESIELRQESTSPIDRM
jgi:hypothetical protein